MKAPKSVTWLVIANTVKADVYEINHKEHTLVETLEDNQGRLKSQELAEGKPGSYKTNHAARGHFIPRSEPQEEEHKNFASEIAHFLEKNQQKKRYEKLIVCAEPHFHGLLNNNMSKALLSVIIRSIEKDYIPLPQTQRNKVVETIIHETPEIISYL